VVEKVTRQLTQGEPLERFDCLAWVASPVNWKVKEQSEAAYAICKRFWELVKVHTATKAKRVKGRTLRRVVMPYIVDLFCRGGG
jgi:hypothetical protein